MGVISGWIGTPQSEYDGLEKRIQNMINLKQGLNGAASEALSLDMQKKQKSSGHG